MEEKTVGVSLGLSEEEKIFLKDLAKRTIERYLNNEPAQEIVIDSKKLKEKRGVFVTLNKKGNLRGCIGTITSHCALYLAVIDMAEYAAFQDPRFPPLKKEELDEIDIEISVLTPLEKVEDINEIIVGTHGLFIKRKFNSGLLLPQVPVTHKWQRDTFLEQTCVKADLPRDAWKEKETEIFKFSADVF